MMLFVRRTVLWAMALAPAVFFGPGCADSESILFIRQVQAPVIGTGGGCNYQADPSSLFIASGTLDLAFRLQYSAALLVGNQLVPRGNSSQLRTETARVRIEGTVVRAEDPTGAVVWGPVTVPGSGFIDPANGSNPTYGITQTTLLGSQIGASLAAQLQNDRTQFKRLTSIVKVFGRTLGGMTVESGEWRFPITVCFACLISFPPEANNPNLTPVPNCAQVAVTGMSVGRPCVIGQDDTVDCRICKTVYPRSSVCEP